MHQTPKDALLDAINKQSQKREGVILLLDNVQFGTIKVTKKDGKILFYGVDIDGEELVETYKLVDKKV